VIDPDHPALDYLEIFALYVLPFLIAAMKG
jgi:hypothetical protein